MMDKFIDFWGEVYSIVRALTRLFFLTMAMVASGVHIILFSRTEICNIELRGMPLLCDREKMGDHMSFIEKTCLENPELVDYADEQMRRESDLPEDYPHPYGEDEDEGE